MRQVCGDLINLGSTIKTDAKLVFAFAGRNEFVGLGIDIGIHSNGNRSDQSKLASDFIDASKLRLALDVEGINSFTQREGDLLTGFADSGKCAPVSAAARF